MNRFYDNSQLNSPICGESDLNPNSNPNHGSSQSVSCFPLKDPANWESDLLAAIVWPRNSPTTRNRPQNNSFLDLLNETPVLNSSAQVGSTLGNQQSSTSKQFLQRGTDGFPVPYSTCYNLNLPPRPEQDAVWSGITGPSPFNPITPDTRRKHTDSQWTPVINRNESQRIEDVDNHYIGDSTSCAVATPQRHHTHSQWVPVMDRNESQRIEDVDNHYIGDSTSCAVTTPQRKHTDSQWVPVMDRNESQRIEDVVNHYIGDSTSCAVTTPQRKHTDSQWVPVMDRNESQRIEDVDNHYIGDSTSSAVATPQKENLVLEERDELGIDLNKTPNQKTPTRRKKHRPKVITEGKPRKTRTPKDPKNKALNETRVKRKYVRRTPQGNGVEATPRVKKKYARRTPQGNGDEVTPRVKRKYVRKKGVDQSGNSEQKTKQEEATKPDVETPAKSCRRQLNFDLEECVGGSESQMRREKQRINLNDNPRDIEQERRINSILERSAMKVAQNNMYAGVTTYQESPKTHMQSLVNGPSTPMVTEQLNVLARNLTIKNSRNSYNQVGPVFTNLQGREPNGQMANFYEGRGVKRSFVEQINPRDLSATDSIYMYSKLLLGGDIDCSNNDLTRILESHKKTKMQNDLSTPRPEDNLRGQLRQANGVYRNVSALQLLYSCTEKANPNYQVNGHHFLPHMATATQYLQKQQGSSRMQPIMDRSQRWTRTQGHGVNSVNAMVSWNQAPATPSKDNSTSAVVTHPATLLNKGTPMRYSPSQRSNGNDNNMFLQLRKDASQVHKISFTKPKGGPRKRTGVVSVENITSMLEGLCIYDDREKARNALVPYRGDNNSNAIIPFEPIRKRKPRAKVDLDPETDRLWKFLMGKEGSEATESMDKDKEKWWEDERRVFRGRADSFIARMHLVQGDRRFSRWKGSVVDSVIGVFLTQNVSDHLSSSAFMSLAAKFSLKTTSNNTTYYQDDACVLVEEPIEIVLPTDKILRQPVVYQSSFVSCESFENTRHNNISSANKHNRASEEVILSQDSLDSSTVQTVDEIRSSSGSNSEAEDQTTGFETNHDPTPANKLMQAEKVSMFKELLSHENQIPQINDRSQYMHHLPATPMEIPMIGRVNNMKTGLHNMGSCDSGLIGGESMSGMTGAYHKSNVSYQQNETSRFQVPAQARQYDFLSNHPKPPAKAENGIQKQDLCSEDRSSAVDKQNRVESAAMEANSKERNYASKNPLNRPDKNTLQGEKGTGKDEKNKSFDWDSLRREVLLKREKRERSKDARDSLDYEALRRAHVNEISDAIRERGMNNLLADRIKDFLDRLVRDHESIDLEWLRDVPPDKAKDYLLSIRGLGLKSVECVRLLTLHHLAFPVDTNVGRIAVRLGWVPLQPLPESLQLHLLEMYPVLESIQKYLWPRLCKLDQLTLYELHYQMITFGKVFCTKSKPNCNACPMRAECRHFASAFASARLALPGPEEKRIVPSDAPNTQNATYTNPPVISRHMPLPPAENNCNKDAQFLNEPIIEEPTTPEPETAELSLSDIEDQYYDDADEIPTIKLDMNEFTTNLQKMQDSTEIQGDMSKALVALNPQAASIPTPKLKNVSRLRTEHLVYELPDTHPLLEGLYKREPDDPSPYLLAIWTPGETAHSMQPPERGCQAQESGMLCDRTTCFSCNSIKEANSQVVRGTILMPCRTATRGSFPLNGTYFQVNEMFADHASSLKPIDVPRAWIWNLPRRTVYFGTSVSTIFKGLTTQEIQQCFWRGFVCVRGFDQKTRAPRPLMARLHFPASKLVKPKNEDR